MKTSNLISYYKECYQADTRTLVINNFFGSRVENRFVIDGEDEVLNGNMERYPIPDDYADALRSNLTLYKREKVLYCCAFFVIGRQEEALRKDSKICAPLFLFPAELDSDEFGSYLKVDLSKRQINVNFLNSIKHDEVEDLYESIAEVDQVLSSLTFIDRLIEILDSKVQDVSSHELLMYPTLTNEAKIKKLLQPKQLDAVDGFKVFPTVSFGVFRRSTNTQGVLSELQTLSQHLKYSPPLRFLLEGDVKVTVEKLARGWTPATLSESQEQIIGSTNSSVCTLVIGPPGTGKSFTIAALALEYLSKGKKVLIASKTDQAVDVISRKIEDDLGVKGVTLRAGKSGYKKELKGHLQSLLTQTRRRPKDEYDVLGTVQKVLRILDGTIKEYESVFVRNVRNELRWGRFLSLYLERGTLLDKIKTKYIHWRVSMQRPHWEITQRFLESHQERIHKTKEYIEMTFMRTVHHALYSSRKMFRDFLKSLTARRSSRKDELYEGIHLPTLLSTFPVWLVSMSDVSDVFPLKEEAFDLAIIDEATQCDIASSIPILQRAKRVVVVGDPKQLRHVSFLSRSFQKSLSRKYQIDEEYDETILNYRETSLLDLVNERISDQRQVVFLNEHYRSKPDIISYSNQTFYHGDLSIMTHEPEKDQISHLHIKEVKGTRSSQGVNRKEADQILLDIQRIIDEEREIEDVAAQSIGILSPFRDQVDYLGGRILKEISESDIVRHKIICGTAYSFQGEERDIMLLSMTIDDASHHSAVIHLNKPDVFNVAITRARSLQNIYISFTSAFDPGRNV
ncbi:MAG: AAA family ATPase [Ekhidna sp.]|nr:AAA family ATPase [Ekhidna sp.]